MGLSSCILGGDFNVHSRMWNPYCTTPRNAGFLENLITTYQLQILNDDHETRLTRERGHLHSIIDLTLATPGARPNITDCRVV